MTLLPRNLAPKPLWAAIMEHRRLVVTVTALVMLVGASFGLAIYAESRHQVQLTQSANVQAHILAESVSAALAFGDQDAIREYITALRANPDIEAVAVYDDKGALVARYGPEKVASDLNGNGRPDPALIEIRAPVVQNGVKLGMVYFRQRTEALGTRVARYSGAGLLVIVASLMLTIMAFDSRALTLGNRRLREEMVERERAEAAMRQSQKMEAVGRLTGGIAHDFNNMLAVVLGNLDLLLRRFPDADPKLLRSVSMAQEGAKRAAALTQRLLAFSRLQPLDPRPADIAKSVTDMSDLLRRTLGETIAIEAVRGAGLWRAHVDVGQLETALVNLAVNARDAMPDGGKLTIETGNAYLDRAYANTQEDVAAGHYVMVAVTDTGTGMTPDVIEKVFEPFFTTKPVGQGTGLGLSQVHGFIKQSGGHIAIYSEVGHGTVIKLYLPRSQEEAEVSAPDVTRSLGKDRRNVTVLVVDDEAGVREFATEALGDLGYDVLSAENADQAIQVVGDHPDISVLLTDVVMPGRSGRALADEVTRSHPDMRVLYMTGYTQNAIVHNGVLDAGTHLITKPFTIARLNEEMEALLAG